MRFIILIALTSLLLAEAMASPVRYSPSLNLYAQGHPNNMTAPTNATDAALQGTVNDASASVAASYLPKEGDMMGGPVNMENRNSTAWVGATTDNISAYDAIIKQDASGAIYGHKADGILIASDTSAPYDIGAVINSVTAYFRSGTTCNAVIAIDAPNAYTNSSIWYYQKMTLVGIGYTKISTYDLIDIIHGNKTAFLILNGRISNLWLVSKRTANSGKWHIYLGNPSSIQIDRVIASCPFINTYAVNNGGIHLDGNVTGAWLNRILYCPNLYGIKFTGISDSWIFSNAISGNNMTLQAILLAGVDNDDKILYNNIITDKGYGIYRDSSSTSASLQIVGNYFEPHSGTPAGINAEIPIRFEGATSASYIGQNRFIRGNEMGIWGVLSYSSIMGNDFYDMNYLNNAAYSDIRLIASSSYNVIIGNTFRNDHSTTKAAAIVESGSPDHNEIQLNTIKGSGYSATQL